MASPTPHHHHHHHQLPLQEKVVNSTFFQRLVDLLILSLLLALLCHRLLSDEIHAVAFVCESWFAFYWFLLLNSKWNQVAYRTHPHRLLKRFEEVAAVDMFVTTADPVLEPPIVTVNTVLSLLAVDYPANRLACYVSDDGASPVTYYALREAAEFAKTWVPFCRRHGVQVRAPSVYFADDQGLRSEHGQEWEEMKAAYSELKGKIERAAEGKYFPHDMKDELVEFRDIEKGNHPSIVKVISENRGVDDIPSLIYVAREKRPQNHHHFKAGAMNVLTRVSGVMTSAPFIVNVDCDMFVSNPEVVLHAMCLLFGFESEVFSGYVQHIQEFYGALRDDPFGNQSVVMQKISGMGIGGIQGPFYGGTGCFHRRKIIYGLSPGETSQGLTKEQLRKIYGNSEELTDTVYEINTSNPSEFVVKSNPSTRATLAEEVAASDYESKTEWGREIGWIYGSLTEDVLTGLKIHARGWKSVYMSPSPSAFLGNAPIGGPIILTQVKRWATGLLEILFGTNSPVFFAMYKKLSFRQCLAYLLVNFWAICALFESVYALIPAYCFITNTSFMPKPSSGAFLILAGIFVIYNLSTLKDYFSCGLSARCWWNNQKMNRVYSSSAFLLAFFSYISKTIGLSETIFEVTKKDMPTDLDLSGRFTFDSSPNFVPGTALTLVNLAGVLMAAIRFLAGGECSYGLGEVVCSAYLLLCLWPFVRGLYGKGIYGIPWPVVVKGAVLASVFLQICWMGRVKSDASNEYRASS